MFAVAAMLNIISILKYIVVAPVYVCLPVVVVKVHTLAGSNSFVKPVMFTNVLTLAVNANVSA